jgi:hypothetical protein
MPAGSGPYCSAPITSGSITGTAVTLTTPACNTNTSFGVMISVFLAWTPSATQTITCKLYQVSTSGTQVGPSAGLIATATGTTEASAMFQFQDTSAFANNTTGAVWVASLTANTGTGTVDYAFIQVQTMAPVL